MKNVTNLSTRFGLAMVLALLAVLVFSTVSAFAQGPILDEDFDYGATAGDLTTQSGGIWAAHSASGSNPVQYGTSSLSMAGYGSSGIGGSAAFANGSGSREDVNRAFTTQSSGTVFYAALVNLSAADSTDAYFMHLNSIFSPYRARLFAQDSSGNLRFGLSTGSGTGSYSTTDFSYNTTYLVVVKYDVDSGDSTLYVLDTYSATEPGTALVTSSGSADNVSAIAIRQTSGSLAGTIDGVRVATTWEDVVAPTVTGFTLTKIADPDPVAHHSAVTYTISLSSTAAFSDSNALLTDTLPIETDFLHWIVSPTVGSVVRSGDAITWTGEITASDLITFTFVATHTGNYNEVVTNTAYFSGTGITAMDAATFSVPAATPELSIGKTGAHAVVAGEAIVYHISLQNTGGISANNVVLIDTLPVSVTYVNDNSGWTALTSTIGSNEVVGWGPITLAAGASNSFNLTATVNSSVTNGTVITNTVGITTSTPGDDPTNNIAQFTSTVHSLVSIYNIQYTTEITGDSPYKGQTVATEGVVYAIFGSSVFIQDGNGAWNGIYVYNPSVTPALGDRVRVLGEIAEYYSLTEFGSGAGVTIISSGNVLPAAEVLATGNVTQEQWESVFVRTENSAVTNHNLGHGEWAIDDGSGDARVDDMGNYTYVPTTGDQLSYVQGPLNYSFGNFKIEPRNDADIGLSKPGISKDAPAQVNPGESYTYTITLENQLGYSMSNVIVTDTVPADVNVLQVLDGGINNSGVISWSISSLDHLNVAQFRFVVTPTINKGTIVNNDYAIVASNYTTPTLGAAVTTVVGELGIYNIQGDGSVSPYVGKSVTVQGVVFADMQEADERKGFFMQDAAGDGNPNTSDGIFVYDQSHAVTNGDWVEVTGEVNEYKQQTQMENISSLVVISSGNTITPTPVTLPEATSGDLEQMEGMYVTFPHTFTVQQNYFQGRYGQITLAIGGRLLQPTNIYAPGSAEAIALADENARRVLVLDDGYSGQNPNPIPYIGANNTLRAGDVVAANLSGALDEGSITSYGNIDYRLQPFTTTAVSITRVNQRTAAPPAVGGSLKVASFNVLNYFTTLDNSGNICGPSGDMGCRGADTAEEFTRQRTKIITAILAINADIIGLMEIENNGYTATGAIYNLVDGLNAIAGAGTYAFVNPGVAHIGADVIAVGLIYKPATVDLVGNAAILDSNVDPNFVDGKNRPTLAQTFMEKSSGEKLTVVVNHLKSKGSPCDSLGDPQDPNGQGNCNLTRTKAMTAEVNWLAGDPTGSGDPDFLIIGDLNAYAMEDPISVAKNAGYTDLLKHFEGAAAYTYVFDGLAGYLDHSLANATLTAQVAGVTVWHINADEPKAIDYDMDHNPPGYYAPNAYRASDHDPVIVGLNLNLTSLSIDKSVVGSGEGSGGTMNLPASGIVTYTIVVANSGNTTATNVRISDTLPLAIDFESWVTQGSAMLPVGHQITWGPYNIAAGSAVTISFRAVITTNAGYIGQTVTNHANYTAGGVSGSDEAAFTVKGQYTIFLPLVMKH